MIRLALVTCSNLLFSSLSFFPPLPTDSSRCWPEKYPIFSDTFSSLPQILPSTLLIYFSDLSSSPPCLMTSSRSPLFPPFFHLLQCVY